MTHDDPRSIPHPAPRSEPPRDSGSLALPGPRTLVQSLRDTVCPACGAGKRELNTFCRRCYFWLSPAVRDRLYDGVGHGYKKAIAAALRELGVARPHWPAPPAASRKTRASA